MLSAYKGTVIVVSHDRAFLDELVTGTIALEGDGLVRDYVGGYTDWLRQRRPAEEKKPAAPAAKADWKENAPKKRRLSYKEQREQEALLKEQEELPARLEAL